MMKVEVDSTGIPNLEVGNKPSRLIQGIILMGISSSYVHV